MYPEKEAHGGAAFVKLVDVADDGTANGHTVARAERLDDPPDHEVGY